MDIKKDIDKLIQVKINNIYHDKPQLLAGLEVFLITKTFGTIKLSNVTIKKSPNYNERLGAKLFVCIPYRKHGKGVVSHIYFEEQYYWELIENKVYEEYKKELNNDTHIDIDEIDIDTTKLAQH